MLKFLILSIGAMQLSLFSKSDVVYKAVQLACYPHPNFIRNATCRLKPIDWYKAVINMESYIVNKLANISLHTQLFAKNYANRFKPTIINGTGNICEFMDKKRFPAISTIFLNILKSMSNVNHSCPYTGRLIAKNMYVNEKLVPVVLSLGTYKFVFNFYEGWPYRNVGTVTIDIEAMEKLPLRSDGSDPKRKRRGKKL